MKSFHPAEERGHVDDMREQESRQPGKEAGWPEHEEDIADQREDQTGGHRESIEPHLADTAGDDESDDSQHGEWFEDVGQ